MTTTYNGLLLWSPRVLGILVSLFIGMFALDAFSAGKPFLQAIPDFFVHLIPAFVLLGVVIASFRRPWIGAVGFIGCCADRTWAKRSARCRATRIAPDRIVTGGRISSTSSLSIRIPPRAIRWARRSTTPRNSRRSISML